jgi:hypothetical protein
MKYSASAVKVGQVGGYVEIVVGTSTVHMTVTAAEEVVRALERAIDQTQQPHQKERVH